MVQRSFGEGVQVSPNEEPINSHKVNNGFFSFFPKTGIIESSEQFQGSDRALVARTLVDGCPENKVPIRLMNLQNEAIDLGKGTFIAELSPEDVVINLKEDS